MHKTIKKVTEDIENFRFNTAISSLMIYFNEVERTVRKKKINEQQFLILNSKFLILLSSFAPHLSEELWHQLGYRKSIHTQPWPKYNPRLIKEEKYTLVIQINGKLRDKVEVSRDISQKDAEKIVRDRKKLKQWTEGRKIKKIIFVPGRLINIVTV